MQENNVPDPNKLLKKMMSRNNGLKFSKTMGVFKNSIDKNSAVNVKEDPNPVNLD